jgi:hypothetical protein
MGLYLVWANTCPVKAMFTFEYFTPGLLKFRENEEMYSFSSFFLSYHLSTITKHITHEKNLHGIFNDADTICWGACPGYNQ